MTEIWINKDDGMSVYFCEDGPEVWEGDYRCCGCIAKRNTGDKIRQHQHDRELWDRIIELLDKNNVSDETRKEVIDQMNKYDFFAEKDYPDICEKVSTLYMAETSDGRKSSFFSDSQSAVKYSKYLRGTCTYIFEVNSYLAYGEIVSYRKHIMNCDHDGYCTLVVSENDRKEELWKND